MTITLSAKKQLYRWLFVVEFVEDGGDVSKVYVDRHGRMVEDPNTVSVNDQFALTGVATRYRATWQASQVDGNFHLMR